MSLSVVVPIYNEIELVERSVRSINSFLAAHFDDYEIVIVESGSTDGSGEVCDRLAAQLERVILLHEGARKGFGSAVRLGYRHATKNLIWLVTVDVPFPLETIFKALPLLSKYDCVLSYRINDSRPSYDRVRSYVYNVLSKAILGLGVTHVNSAFKVFKRKTIEGLSLSSNGWLIDAEILYEITRRGISYVEIPVELVDRTVGKSSVTFLTVFSVIKELTGLLRAKTR